MPRRAKVVSVEVIGEGDQRFVVETYANGDIVRRPVAVDMKPRRKPRKPIARGWQAKIRSGNSQ